MKPKNNNANRPSWEQYFLDIARVVRGRSNCLRQSVGALLVQGKHIIATGYNGTPAGIKNCFDGGCERCLKRHENSLKANERKDLCICLHAEENALLQSAYHGVSTKGSILYSTIAPCAQCAKSLINAGISAVIFEENHSDTEGLKLLKKAGVKTEIASSLRSSQ